MNRRSALFLAIASSLVPPATAADWPTVRGNVQRTGFVAATLAPPFRLAWARYFVGERLSTAAEPIVAGGKLFVGTHSGNLYALDAATGQPVWRFQANGPFLHSPAFADGAAGTLVAACMDGTVYALDPANGKLRWSAAVDADGMSASPAIAEGRVHVGSRSGAFVALDLASGKALWRRPLGAPIRQTAALAEGRVVVTAEDLRTHCLDAKTGEAAWVSDPLVGQTARDYYPVVARAGDRAVVVVRTNPVIQFSGLIGRDRHAICQAAGADESDWRKLDAWLKSEKSVGSHGLWAREQEAIVAYLGEHREARTCFVLDAATGKEVVPPPVLWAAGCQGVGSPPVALPDGRLFVLYRSAYGNWSLGVAPLVALGLLDLAQNHITPLRHTGGTQPPWNTFWGTADESQNFVVAADTALLIHQGTLSGLDLRSAKLFPIAGNRDTWGGFHNLPWARNEWHGPARSGVAVAANHLYWQTGSRILGIAAGEQGAPAKDAGIDGSAVATERAPQPAPPDAERLRRELRDIVAALLSKPWAPLYVEPGLAGREFLFDNSGDVFEALARAYPHLPADMKDQVKSYLAAHWQAHPPFAREAWYPLDQGERRELFWVPKEVLARSSPPYHPFGNVYAVWLYAQRCDEWERLRAAWPRLRASLEDFAKTNWQLNPAKGDLHANRYLASLIAFAAIAQKLGEADLASQATAKADATADALVAWWRRAADQMSLPTLQNVQQLDTFIGKGDPLFLMIRPHKSKIALFHDLTPEVAGRVSAKAADAAAKVWDVFHTLCPTWHLVGEERQVHFGENFVDPPDFALDAFRAYAWLSRAPAGGLDRHLDIPFCRADLAHLTKIAIALEAKER